jgi:hypothetical protein
MTDKDLKKVREAQAFLDTLEFTIVSKNLISNITNNLHTNTLKTLKLESQLEIAIRAIEFYADRAVYYKSRKFPGDDGEIECSDIAEDALKQIRSES